MQKNSYLRKRLGVAAAAAFAISALMPTLAVAATPDISAGELFKFNDRPGTTGGEFGVDRLLTTGSGSDFVTFCVEHNEFLSFGTTYKVASITTGAIMGGVSGGNPDPISNATAWLYKSFRAGTLGGYAYVGTNAVRTASADALQDAIWFLEGEIGAVSGQALTWKNLAIANGTSLYGVRVMNVQTLSGGTAQDQLVMIPEPETYAMLLAGLGLMGFVARRRQRKLASA